MVDKKEFSKRILDCVNKARADPAAFAREVEKNELLEKSGGSDQLEKDAAAEDEEEDEVADREKEVKGETTMTTAVNGQNGKEDEDEDNVHDDDTKVDGECFLGHFE